LAIGTQGDVGVTAGGEGDNVTGAGGDVGLAKEGVAPGDDATGGQVGDGSVEVKSGK
jgi:hypothetical protein